MARQLTSLLLCILLVALFVQAGPSSSICNVPESIFTQRPWPTCSLAEEKEGPPPNQEASPSPSYSSASSSRSEPASNSISDGLINQHNITGTATTSSSSNTTPSPSNNNGEIPELLSFSEWRARHEASSRGPYLSRVHNTIPTDSNRDNEAPQITLQPFVSPFTGSSPPSNDYNPSSPNDPSNADGSAASVGSGSAFSNNGLSSSTSDLTTVDTSGLIHPLPDVGSGSPSSDPLLPLKSRTNYASLDCSATVHYASPQSRSASAILSPSKDKYMLTPCNSAETFIVIELCDEIEIDNLVLANFEFFSSMFKLFRVRAAQTYIVGVEDEDPWVDLGTFRASNIRSLQVFRPKAVSGFYKYLRIDFLSHYGSEHFCPISLLRVYGLNQLDAWRRDQARERIEIEIEKYYDSQGVNALMEERNPEVFESTEGDHTNNYIENSSSSSTPFSIQDPSVQETISSSTEVLPAGTAETTPAPESLTSPEKQNTSLPYQDIDSTVSSKATPTASQNDTVPSSATSAGPESQPTNTPVTSADSSNISSSINVTNSTTMHLSPSNASECLLLDICEAQDFIGHDFCPVKSTAATSSDLNPMCLLPYLLFNQRAIIPKRLVNSVLGEQDSLFESVPIPSSTTTTTPSSSSTSSPATEKQQQSPPSAQPHRPVPDVRPATQQQPVFNSGSSNTVNSGESIYGNIMKRLSALEQNTTLSVRFMEEQGSLIRDAFIRLETRLGDLESQKLKQDQIIRRIILDLDLHRAKVEQERIALASQVNMLSGEIIFSRQLSVAQLTGLLGLVVFVGLTRASPSTPFINYALPPSEREKGINTPPIISRSQSREEKRKSSDPFTEHLASTRKSDQQQRKDKGPDQQRHYPALLSRTLSSSSKRTPTRRKPLATSSPGSNFSPSSNASSPAINNSPSSKQQFDPASPSTSAGAIMKSRHTPRRSMTPPHLWNISTAAQDDEDSKTITETSLSPDNLVSPVSPTTALATPAANGNHNDTNNSSSSRALRPPIDTLSTPKRSASFPKPAALFSSSSSKTKSPNKRTFLSKSYQVPPSPTTSSTSYTSTSASTTSASETEN